MLNHKLLGSVSSLPSDENFENVTLLLSGDGTNGAQNNTFLDSSTNNFTITRNGNTTQGSFSPYGSLWSNYFSSSKLNIASSTNLNITGGAFTIEAWVFPQSVGSDGGLIVAQDDGTSGSQTFQFKIANSTNYLQFIYWTSSTRGSAVTVASSTAVPFNQWSHVAVVYTGTTLYLFLNGVSVFSNAVASMFAANVATGIASYNSASTSGYFGGYISNIRVLKGTAQYTSAFTPSTTPLTAITNTVLLTCQSNRFIDNSSNAFAITTSGTPSVQRFSPFNPTAPYSTSVIGGSAYLNGSTDYLQVPAGSAFAYGTGDFTIEGWFYSTADLPQYGRYIFTQTVSGINYVLVALGDGTGSTTPENKILATFNAGTPSGNILSSTTFQHNTWNHLAVVRSAGVITVYLNGVGGTPVSYTGNLTNTTYTPTIGRYTHSAGNQFAGHLSSLRVTKTAVYTSNFTPSTAPLTAITNTSLLTNFTNAGIPDLAMQNNLETVGNAQVSTSVKKYGTGSLAFDGTGDYLVAPNSPQIQLNNTYTIEFWVYPNSIAGNFGLLLRGYYDSGTLNWTGLNYSIRWIGGNTLRFYFYGTNNATEQLINVSNALSATTWTHVAMVRNGTSGAVYINGVSSGTISSLNTTAASSRQLDVGIWNYSTGSEQFNGYIDDLRISKVCRYTANFTPPASALPTY